MANILQFTEQFDNAYWQQISSIGITANTHAAPAFAGGSAGMADTLDDANAAGQSSVYGEESSIADDSSDWTGSVFIRKDAVTSRFPEVLLQITGGVTAITVGVSVNTSTGAIAASGTNGGPTASGVVDVDATWWRVWLRHANNSSGNTVLRLHIFPARSDVLGDPASSAVTGSIVAWGANATNTSAVQTYDPNPTYSFSEASPTDGMAWIRPVGFS